MFRLVRLLTFTSLSSLPLLVTAADSAKPNVLFIAIDDMRSWTGFQGNAQAKTPNMDRLAKSGVAFTRAYTAYALCNPSRTALLTGLRPDATGVMGNGDDWRTAVPAERPSLPGYFRAQGWRTMTAGKVFHGSKLRREDWDVFIKDNQREEKDNEKQDWILKPGKTPDGFVIGSNEIQPVDSPEEELVDYKTASYGVEKLGKTHEWTNLAAKPEHTALKAELAKWMPGESNASSGKGKMPKKKKKEKPAVK